MAKIGRDPSDMTTYEKCRTIRTVLLNRTAEVMMYENWSDKFAAGQIREVPEYLAKSESGKHLFGIQPAELTDEHPKIYKDVVVTYQFFGSNFKKSKIQKAVDLSVNDYCGVMEMFRSFTEVKIEVEYHEQ